MGEGDGPVMAPITEWTVAEAESTIDWRVEGWALAAASAAALVLVMMEVVVVVVFGGGGGVCDGWNWKRMEKMEVGLLLLLIMEKKGFI